MNTTTTFTGGRYKVTVTQRRPGVVKIVELDSNGADVANERYAGVSIYDEEAAFERMWGHIGLLADGKDAEWYVDFFTTKFGWNVAKN